MTVSISGHRCHGASADDQQALGAKHHQDLSRSASDLGSNSALLEVGGEKVPGLAFRLVLQGRRAEQSHLVISLSSGCSHPLDV